MNSFIQKVSTRRSGASSACSAAQEPEQLVDDGLEVDPLVGSQQRKPCQQVEAHLVAEGAERSGPGAVVLACAAFQHVAQQPEEVSRPIEASSLRIAIASFRQHAPHRARQYR